MENFECRILKIGSNKEEEIPSCVALSRESSVLLFGNEAINADPDDYDLLIDWKVLVGKTQAEIAERATSDEDLHRVLGRQKNGIQSILNSYIKHICDRLNTASLFEESPEIIVGIPVTADYEKKKWRDRYKLHISNAFKAAGYKKPHFFPEPFAVFQHHWNNGSIKDTGDYQNVFIVDVGGGTTNVCLIQTTRHGILARGGGNKVPHGVRSLLTGGTCQPALNQ